MLVPQAAKEAEKNDIACKYDFNHHEATDMIRKIQLFSTFLEAFMLTVCNTAYLPGLHGRSTKPYPSILCLSQ